MIGSATPRTSPGADRPCSSARRPGVFRAEDYLAAARHRRLAVDHVSCRSPGRDPRHIRPDGRRPHRALRLHHGPPPPCRRAHLYRRRPSYAERDVTGRIARGLALIPEDRQREGLVLDPLGRRQPDARQPEALRHRASISAASARRRRSARPSATCRSRSPTPALDVSSLCRRQPAEGRHRQGADDRPQGAADGRAVARHRRRRQGRCLPHHAPPGADGLGILFVTSDLDEVMALSDRIAVMSNGRLTAR